VTRSVIMSAGLDALEQNLSGFGSPRLCFLNYKRAQINRIPCYGTAAPNSLIPPNWGTVELIIKNSCLSAPRIGTSFGIATSSP